MIPRGSARNWMSLIPPPDGWDFYPTKTKYFNMVPLPIFATRDVESEPVLPDLFIKHMVDKINRDETTGGVSRQGLIAGKTHP